MGARALAPTHIQPAGQCGRTRAWEHAPSRRHTHSSAVARVGRLRQQLARMDLVLRHGIIVDGNGGPAFVGDVGIKDGLIARIGDLADIVGVEEIDATGKHVMPGATR